MVDCHCAWWFLAMNSTFPCNFSRTLTLSNMPCKISDTDVDECREFADSLTAEDVKIRSVTQALRTLTEGLPPVASCVLAPKDCIQPKFSNLWFFDVETAGQVQQWSLDRQLPQRSHSKRQGRNAKLCMAVCAICPSLWEVQNLLSCNAAWHWWWCQALPLINFWAGGLTPSLNLKISFPGKLSKHS